MGHQPKANQCQSIKEEAMTPYSPLPTPRGRIAPTGHALLLTLLLVLGQAQDSQAFLDDTSKDTWAGLTGYGQSIPGWGQTTERVETLDFVPRYAHVVFADLGSGWYRGFHSTLVELPVHLVVSQDISAMVGLNFLACYTFTANEQWRPYIFGGGGPLYSFADITGMGADWNGNYQFALGLEHSLTDKQALLLELRYHHVSNAGSADPNVPLNSIKFMVGIRF